MIVALVLTLVGASYAAQLTSADPLASVNPVAKLKAKKTATRKKPPPTRPCLGDCVVPSKYKTYEGFLLWAGDDARQFWRTGFQGADLSFTPARHVVIAGQRSSRTNCRAAAGGTVLKTDLAYGPFYCPIDGPGTVFLPTDTLRRIVFERAPDYRLRDYRERDFAFSVIVAHEWGHHVQNLLGVFAQQPRVPSIRLELQADCLAGLWAHSAWERSLLEKGDIEEGLRIASAAGDRPGISPGDPRAHGTSKQRAEWFMRGYTSGRGDRCDTSKVPIR